MKSEWVSCNKKIIKLSSFDLIKLVHCESENGKSYIVKGCKYTDNGEIKEIAEIFYSTNELDAYHYFKFLEMELACIVIMNK